MEECVEPEWEHVLRSLSLLWVSQHQKPTQGRMMLTEYEPNKRVT